MLDVAVAYNRYKFLGDEFLTWLWFVIEKAPGHLKTLRPEVSSLKIGNRIVLENRLRRAIESITIKGDDADLEEGILALRKGALVTEMNLCLQSGDQEWRFTLKGESLNISGLKTPAVGAVETAEDVEGAVIEKAYLYERVIALVDDLFANFVKIRISDDWQKKTVPKVKRWIGAAPRKD